MTQEHTQEKRRYPRVEAPKGMWVAWQGSTERFVSRVSNLSLNGVFIPTPEPPPVGTIVKLLFEAPGGDVNARAAVRRAVPGRGMGVEFLAMGHQDRARLQQLLRRMSR